MLNGLLGFSLRNISKTPLNRRIYFLMSHSALKFKVVIYATCVDCLLLSLFIFLLRRCTLVFKTEDWINLSHLSSNATMKTRKQHKQPTGKLWEPHGTPPRHRQTTVDDEHRQQICAALFVPDTGHHEPVRTPEIMCERTHTVLISHTPACNPYVYVAFCSLSNQWKHEQQISRVTVASFQGLAIAHMVQNFGFIFQSKIFTGSLHEWFLK